MLPTLKKVLMAGAPVPADLHKMLKEVMGEGGETMAPYGATESLPIASFNGSEMLAETASQTAEGKGYCVGRPLDEITIKVIKSTDEIIENWDDALALPCGEIGEITIKGPVVSPEYNNKIDATKHAKIKDSDGKLWHRMGDSGYFDEKGRLWFCGRKAHRVITEKRIYYPVCCEAIFNKHPDVFRTALVGVGKGDKRKPVLAVEPMPGKMPLGESAIKALIEELKKLGEEKDFTSEIQDFLFHKSFPVDIRHNAKIFREKLSGWAEDELKHS
jgi:acyl-CoA synthetase (AMP-forming)/AMP-acid ligase II